MELFNLTGRRAIITGGTRGLGYGIAEGLMEAGAEVVVAGSSEKAKDVAQAFRNRGFVCHGIKIDLNYLEKLKEGFEEALNLLGGHVDILVNCAGVQRRHFCTEFPIDEWEEVLRVNLTASFKMSQLFANQIIHQNSKGKIINMASMLSFFGGWTVPAYAASKGGVAQLTKALANEWTEKGINVNAIAPGYMDTEMNTALVNDPQRNAGILSRIPAHRWGTADDLKGLAVFLASDASDYMAGAVIPCDGGYMCK